MATSPFRTLHFLLCLLAPSLHLDAAVEPAPPAGGAPLQILGGGQLIIEGGRVQIMAAPAAAQVRGEGGKPGYLGILLGEAMAEEIELAEPDANEDAEKNRGAGILRVVEDSPAAKAGLLDGDRVMLIDGKETRNTAQFREMIRAGKPDQVVKLTVRRAGKDLELKAKLGPAPDNAATMLFEGQNGAPTVPGSVIFYRRPTQPQPDEESATNRRDMVFLRDGNRLRGTVQSLDPVQGLTLARDGGASVALRETGISTVQFAERSGAESAPPKAILALRDGSWLGGEALTLEHGKISLTLPGGQRLTVPREQAQSITLADGPAPQTYEGPVSMAGWSSGGAGQGRWEYQDGYLRCLSNGPLTRNFERLPDPLDLSFEVLYPAQAQVFNLTLFAGENSSTESPGSLTIQFHPQYLQGTHFDGLRYNQYRFGSQLGSDIEPGKPVTFRYRVLVDRVNGRALIYVNDVKRADWKLATIKAEDLGKCGPGLVFLPQTYNSNQTFQIGRVRLRPWDGREPATGAEPFASSSDQLLSALVPPRDGRIEQITKQAIVLAGQGAVPRREKPLYLRFAAAAPMPELPPATALVRLKQGGEFTVTALHGKGEVMTGTTRFGAEIPLPLSSLRSVDFVLRPGTPEPSGSGPDVLTLLDGTRLTGKLITPTTGDRLRWQIPAANGSLEFSPRDVAGVLFPRAEASSDTTALTGPHVVRLTNGDWLPGEIRSLKDGQLLLQNKLSPELSFPASSLRSLYVSPEAAALVSDGGSGRQLWSKGWIQEQATALEQAEVNAGRPPAWSYHDGTYSLALGPLFSAPSLAHKWPAFAGAYALHLEVDNSASSAFQIQLFNPKDQPTINVYSPGNGRVYVGFNTIPDGLNGLRFGNKDFPVPKSREKKRRISLVLDRPARTFRVIFDDQEVAKVAFKEEEAKAALEVAGINITPQGGRLQSRIGNLRLAPWEGAAAKPADPAAAPATAEAGKIAEAPPAQVIYLANGDEAQGQVDGIAAQFLTLTSEIGSLDLPLQRVAWLHFRGPDAAPSPEAVRLRFHDRGVLSVKDVRIGDDRITCLSLQGQPLDFPASLVKELVYHRMP